MINKIVKRDVLFWRILELGVKIVDELEKKVINTIIKYNLIKNGDKIVLAISGGPDSICMLNILYDIQRKVCQKSASLLANFDIVVAHVNHMIRKEAIDDELYVRDFCVKKGIEFYSKSIDVQKIANNNKIGTEEAGRNIRYSFFYEVMSLTNSNKVAIAHNKNDKVETIIMNVLRGSGISGLKGMGPIKEDKYIRPLLECERFEIEQYCDKKNLCPRIDKTNFNNIYTRNKIRNVVIPYIKTEFNPNIINTIDRLSDLINEEDEYLYNVVAYKYKDMLIMENEKEKILDLKKFNREEKVIKSRVILYTISELFNTTKGIEKIHIEDIIKLCGNNIGNKYLTPNKNIKIMVNNSKIFFTMQV